MLIRQETVRPPWGCSIKQSDSSWRNPAVKRTLTGKSLSQARKKGTQKHLITQVCTHSLQTNTHATFELLSNKRKGNQQSYRIPRPIIQLVGIWFSLRVAPVAARNRLSHQGVRNSVFQDNTDDVVNIVQSHSSDGVYLAFAGFQDCLTVKLCGHKTE